MKKTIDYDDWMKQGPEEASRLILESFDLSQLKRRKRAPGRARRGRKKPPSRR